MAKTASDVGSIAPSGQSLVARTGNGAGVKAQRPSGGLPAIFDPLEAKSVIETYRVAIQYAKRMQKWEECATAVNEMVKWQRGFEQWWTANVGVRLRTGDNQHKRLRADLRSTITLTKAEADTQIKHQQVSRWRKALRHADLAERLFQRYRADAMAIEAENVRGTQGTGENEWYTPADIMVLVREVLGAIDLDPATSKHAQRTVKAKKFYTAAENGLTKPWKGRVWLNPPYAQPHIDNFADKMVAEVTAGNVKAGIMLTHNYTDTAWFHKLVAATSAVCFTRGRLRFVNPDGEPASPTQGQALFYFGADAAKFTEVFTQIGFVMQPREVMNG